MAHDYTVFTCASSVINRHSVALTAAKQLLTSRETAINQQSTIAINRTLVCFHLLILIFFIIFAPYYVPHALSVLLRVAAKHCKSA